MVESNQRQLSFNRLDDEASMQVDHQNTMQMLKQFNHDLKRDYDERNLSYEKMGDMLNEMTQNIKRCQRKQGQSLEMVKGIQSKLKNENKQFKKQKKQSNSQLEKKNNTKEIDFFQNQILITQIELKNQQYKFDQKLNEMTELLKELREQQTNLNLAKVKKLGKGMKQVKCYKFPSLKQRVRSELFQKLYQIIQKQIDGDKPEIIWNSDDEQNSEKKNILSEIFKEMNLSVEEIYHAYSSIKEGPRIYSILLRKKMQSNFKINYDDDDNDENWYDYNYDLEDNEGPNKNSIEDEGEDEYQIKLIRIWQKVKDYVELEQQYQF